MVHNNKNRKKSSAGDARTKIEDPLGFYVGKGAARFSRFLQKYDQFAQPVSLNYKGS
jgi:hypothetical protein